ncbi:MAG: hypothetical protein EOS70_23365 [Mesorhizobium sp.]|uniref:hypothetical protein n=1 Tax=Mesorhizobium sp. TaxID=1871066 RepID=UPI000FE48F1B|nr:hypothetical protein [Mesorhizobium sp.]RWC29830.1 MAG: hypothetical protein EOS70_23365 [Mesorhizobium sp.]
MQTTLSKGDFARRIGVTPGRVSQYIAAGLIGPDALDGQGRNAKVVVAKAIEQIRQRRDIGQALGNGLSTKLGLDDNELDSEPGDAGPSADESTRPTKTPTIDDEIKRERLESERRRNRIAAQEEAVRRGQLLEASRVKAEMTKLAQAIEDENAGMLADFASAIAAEYQVPQRDVLHLLRRIRTEKKAGAADRARRRAASLPEQTETILEDNAA